jgi:hypothetical protein
MAIIDSKLEFSDAQVISASSASTVSGTNVFALMAPTTVAGAPGYRQDAWGTAITPDIGEANELRFNFQVATALNASAYIVAKAYTHTGSGVTSGSLLGSVTFAAADAAGTRKTLKVPTGTVKRWVGVQYSTVGSNMTTGAMDAWLGLDTETPTK